MCTGSKRSEEDRDAKDRQNANQTKTNNEYILSFTVWLRQKEKKNPDKNITVTDVVDKCRSFSLFAHKYAFTT